MRFDTSKIADAIMISVQSYVNSIDEIADAERKRLDQVEATIKQNEGKWTPAYIEEYRRGHATDRVRIGQQMQKKRDAIFPRVMILLTQLNEWADAVFGGAPQQDFISTMTMLKLMPDVKLSKHELQILEGRITNYTERKIFNALSESYGVKPSVEVPDIERIMSEMESIENRVKFCLNYYGGQDQALFDCIDQSGSIQKVQKIQTMAIGRAATDRTRMDALTQSINKAANIRELTAGENEQVQEVLKSGAGSDTALQKAIDNADYTVKNLIRLTDMGDRVKVIA